VKKTQKIIFIVSFVLAILVSSGLVSALDTSALSATPVFSKNTLNIGSSITIRITVQSNTDEQLSLIHVGVNFDWMPSGRFAGPDLSSNPAVLTSKGSYTTPPFMIQVPTNVTLGSHFYFVGVDGTESTNQQEFYWNSSTTSIIVLAANQTGTTITPGPTGGGGGDGQATISPLTLILYFAVAAIIVVIVIAVIVMVIMKRRKKKKPIEPTDTAAPVAEQPTKPTKPAEEENYSI
jgi:hypothetical protein